MRFLLALVLLAGCGEIDVGDLGEETKPPSPEQRCTSEAHQTSADGYFDPAIYNRCLHGYAEREGDGGARD